jgi:hypothetical protein
VKRKVALTAIATIGYFALFATAAHAGAGGSPTPLSSFFVCQGVTGNSPGRVVDIQIPLFNINLFSVKVGGATLACTLAFLFDSATKEAISPITTDENGDPVPPVTGLEGDLKCYAMSARRTPSAGLPPTYNVEDVFGQDIVRLGESRYICAPAKYTQ